MEMKFIRKFLFCFFIVFSITSCFGIESPSNNYYEMLYDPVTKNIISYSIVQYVEANKSNLYNGEYFSKFFGDESPILDRDDRYLITFSKSNLSFPDSNIELVEYHFSKFRHTNSKMDSLLESIYKTNHKKYISLSNWFDNLPNTILNGLIGFYKPLKQHNSVIYISGYMFLNNIKYLFFKNTKQITEQEVQSYIRIRYHNFSPQNITFDENLYLIKFFSRVTQIEYIVIIYYDIEIEEWQECFYENR